MQPTKYVCTGGWGGGVGGGGGGGGGGGEGVEGCVGVAQVWLQVEFVKRKKRGDNIPRKKA